MRIQSIERDPFHVLPFMNVDSARSRIKDALPFLRAFTDELPGDLEALVATSDLQGMEDIGKAQREPRFLGEAVAEEICRLHEVGKGIPTPNRIGIIFCGDLYSRLDRRGGRGDVRSVWLAFAERFRWVAGVAGNHDLFDERHKGSVPDDFRAVPGIHYLDGDTVEVDGLLIGGVSGVIGDPEKPFRKSENDYMNFVLETVLREPDILVLHQNTDFVATEGEIAVQMENFFNDDRMKKPLVVCGHRHWDSPLLELKNGMQVVNVEHRVLVIEREPGNSQF